VRRRRARRTEGGRCTACGSPVAWRMEARGWRLVEGGGDPAAAAYHACPDQAAVRVIRTDPGTGKVLSEEVRAAASFRRRRPK
jgi:hypothetical protein